MNLREFLKRADNYPDVNEPAPDKQVRGDNSDPAKKFQNVQPETNRSKIIKDDDATDSNSKEGALPMDDLINKLSKFAEGDGDIPEELRENAEKKKEKSDSEDNGESEKEDDSKDNDDSTKEALSELLQKVSGEGDYEEDSMKDKEKDEEDDSEKKDDSKKEAFVRSFAGTVRSELGEDIAKEASGMVAQADVSKL